MPLIPTTLDALTPNWFSEALGVEVQDVEVCDAHDGTTGRARLALRYGSTGHSLPSRLFVKLPPADELQRAFVVSSGMGWRETRFYQTLGPEVPLRVPQVYYADADERGEAYLMLLEDLEASDCLFHNASAQYSLDYVRAVVCGFADLHSAYWDSPRFSTDLDWLAAPLQHEIAVHLVAQAMEQFADTMPPVFTEFGELYLAHTDAIHQLWNEGASTVIHGDVHDGNLFLDGDRPGFLDWALVARGPGMRDVGYFLAGTMTPQDRREHQQEMLELYRSRLLAGGVTSPSLETLWQQYRLHAAYVWVGATVTLAMGDAWQPVSYTQKTLERLNQALDDLGSVAAFRSELNPA